MSGGKWVVRRGPSSGLWYATPSAGWLGFVCHASQTFPSHAEALAYAIAQAEVGR